MKKLISSLYSFSKDFTVNGAKVVEKVTLLINYNANTFEIKPSFGTQHFDFSTGSHEWKSWLRQVILVRDAINFAVKELGMVEEEEEIDP